MDYVSVVIGEDLYFYVSGFFDVFFDEDFVVSEVEFGFRSTSFVGFDEFFSVSGDSDTSSSSSGSGFYHYGVGDIFFGDFDGLF